MTADGINPERREVLVGDQRIILTAEQIKALFLVVLTQEVSPS